MNKISNELFLDIAGFTIKLVFTPTADPHAVDLRKGISDFFKGFVTEGSSKKEHFIIEIKDIPRSYDTQTVNNKKHYALFYEKVAAKKARTFYTISIYQFQLMVQNIVYQLLSSANGFLLHSSSINIHGKAMIFIGKSGAGKSTAVKLLQDQYQPLSDDMSIIRKIGRSYQYYQHPFKETHTIPDKNSHKVRLGGVYFVVKKPYCSINSRLKVEEKIQLLIQQLISPTKRMAGNAIEFANSYDSIYELHFSKNAEELTKLMGKTSGI